jgi:hypothetical protein
MDPQDICPETGQTEPASSAPSKASASKLYRSPRLEFLGEVTAITLGSPGTFLESGQEPTPSKT